MLMTSPEETFNAHKDIFKNIELHYCKLSLSKTWAYVRQKCGSTVNLEDQNLIFCKSNASTASRDKVIRNLTDGEKIIKNTLKICQ